MTAALEFREVSHSFGTVPALRGVSVAFAPGEIHAVLGENGAGKTTLVSVAVGLVVPDRGTVLVSGRPVEIRGPRQAASLGIGMVHQHFALAEGLTVAENLCLAQEGFWLSRRRAREIMRRHGLELDAERPVRELSVGERQRLEILKALDRGSRILILDEPTAVLTEGEAEELFARLRHLRDAGRTLLLITHKLAEVEAVADRVVVLRGGRVVYQAPRQEATRAELTRHLAGEAEEGAAPPAPPVRGPLVLSLEGIAARGLGPVDLAVAGGEGVAVAGVAGNGQTELAECIAGLRPVDSGKLRRPPEGLAFISGDRQGTGLALDLSVAENVILKRGLLPDAWLPRRRREVLAGELLRRHPVQHRSLAQPVRELSGGNQQKVVLARELAGVPRLVVAENPTRGLDLAATRFVHGCLREAARAGAAVLLLSTDLDEVLALAHRALVADRGRLHAAAVSRAALTAAMAQPGSPRGMP